MRKPSVSPVPSGFRLLVLALILSSSFSASGATNTPSESAPETAANGKGVLERAGASAKPETIPKSAEPQVFGWIEHVILSPELRWKLDAKLDTGADTSSLDAHKIRRVRYKGKSYVRFSIRDPESGKMVSLRRPYVRSVRIRRHNGNHQRRRVVLMTVCLGNSQRTIEVTLTDRKLFDYPMLLGRSALSGLAVVDPMDTYTVEPDCDVQTDDDDDSTVDAERAEQPQPASGSVSAPVSSRNYDVGRPNLFSLSPQLTNGNTTGMQADIHTTVEMRDVLDDSAGVFDGFTTHELCQTIAPVTFRTPGIRCAYS